MKNIIDFIDKKGKLDLDKLQRYIHKLTDKIDMVGMSQTIHMSENNDIYLEMFLVDFFKLNKKEFLIKHKEEGIN